MKLTKRWFDELESIIKQKAGLAGLLDHPTMIGAAREFVINEILRSVLPPIVHLASGKIIDSRGRQSRQIDIIVYDPHFPVLEVRDGIGLYLIEGVIATIEVKSTINKTNLKAALDNCQSVLNLGITIEGDSHFAEKVIEIKNATGVDEKQAEKYASYKFIPSLYVFGFDSILAKKAVANTIDEWFSYNHEPAVADGLCPVVPRLVVAGDNIGLADDGYLRVDPGFDVVERWRSEYGDQVRHLMSVWKTPNPFGIFISHLMFVVCGRIGLNAAEGIFRYSIQKYLPISEYYEEHMKGAGAWHLCWNCIKSS